VESAIVAALGSVSACITIAEATKKIAKSKFEAERKAQIREILVEMERARRELMGRALYSRHSDFLPALSVLDQCSGKLRKLLGAVEPDFEKKQLPEAQKMTDEELAAVRRAWLEQADYFKDKMPLGKSATEESFDVMVTLLRDQLDSTMNYLGLEPIVPKGSWYCMNCSFVSSSINDAKGHEQANGGHVVRIKT
jgi:hypothetical protein